MGKKKGFVVSVDALLAIFAAFTMFAIVFYFASGTSSNSLDAEYLALQTQNFARTLETTGTLKECVELNTTQNLVSIVENTPPNLCISILITNPSLNYSINTIKSNCETTRKIQFSTLRSFVAEPDVKRVFGAKITMWRQEA